MEFIRLDQADVGGDSDDGLAGRLGEDDAAFARTLSASHASSRSSSRPGTVAGTRRPSSAAVSAAPAPFRHVAIKHRPFLGLAATEDGDSSEEDAAEEAAAAAALAGAGATGEDADASAVVAAMALARERRREARETRPVGARPKAVAESLSRFQNHADEVLASRDTGDYFREHEQDASAGGFAAGVGPGASTSLLRGALARSTLGALDGYKKRDLFASHARRTKTTREFVVLAAAKDPLAGRFRQRADHLLEADDFPPMRRPDKGYQAGPDADVDSRAHPDVMLGLHRMRPTVDEARLEAQVAALSAEHMKRRLAEQTLHRSVQAKVELFGRAQERLEEETTRKQEDTYRALFQRHEEQARNAAAAKKARPVSAPVQRTHKKTRTVSTSSLAAPSEQGEEEQEFDNESPGADERSTPMTRQERDRRDPRTAASHIDVQLLQQQQRMIVDADVLSKPEGFSKRPSTAGKLRVARWADEAPIATSGAHDSPLSHTRSYSHLPSSSPAIELLHRHRPGSAALDQYARRTPAAALPVPVPLIESHFRTEAWSMERRPEHEIDMLTKDMADLAASQERAAEAQEEVAFEDNVAGATVARMKHEARKVERARELEEQRAAARAARHSARAQLAFKTDEWEAHRLGIVALGETEKDHTLAAVKARQRTLVRAGVPLAKVPTHDVAFNSGVVKRKVAPPPVVRAKKEEGKDAPAAGAAGGKTTPASTSRTTAPARTPFGKKGPPVVRGRPASVGSTLAKAQALDQHADDQKFLDGLYGSLLADTVDAHGPNAPRHDTLSMYRGSEDARHRKTRPFSATQAAVGRIMPDGRYQIPLQLVPTSGSTLTESLALAASTQMLRPATSSLLGHSVSHPQLLSSTAARANAAGGVLTQVQGHMHQAESLAAVEQVREAMARARGEFGENVVISRATLERALVPPRAYLTPAQRKVLPTQLSTLVVNPFLAPKKKKTKKKRKGSSKKKKSSASSKKKSDLAPEGLAFPLGTATSEFAGNPLVSDLGLINIGDVASPEAKPRFRSIYLAHATPLVQIFELFSVRAIAADGQANGPPLMSQFNWLQFLSVCGVFGSGSGALALTTRKTLEVFADDADLSVENVDVDELISRPAFLERLARIAQAKCGKQSQSADSMASAAADNLETFLIRFVLPHAMSLAPSDLRMRMVSSAVQGVLQAHNIGLQTMFSLYADASSGTLPLSALGDLLGMCGISTEGGSVDQPLTAALHHQPESTSALFFPSLLELLCRVADTTGVTGDLALDLGSLLQQSWTTFSQRVPAALPTAAAIAASHQAVATNAMGASAATPRDASARGVQFA